MTTSNTPFEDGLEGFGWAEEDDGSYVYGIDDHWKLDASTAELLNEQIKSLLKLHKAAIVAELEAMKKQADDEWEWSAKDYLADRIEQYKKEGK